jgi:2-octaprenyl-6-methoxyphenol hydroxylase
MSELGYCMAIKSQHILIVGAGLVGSAIACMLARAGLSVTLLEEKKPSFKFGAADQRPISLNYASIEVLKTLGVYAALKNVTPIDQVHVTVQSHFGAVKFDRESIGLDYLGQVVVYAELAQALFEQAQEAGVEVVYTQELLAIENSPDCVQVTARANNEECVFKANLLVAADGRDSFCRRYLGMAINKTDGKHQSDVFRLYLSSSHQRCAYQRFTQQGSAAVVPLLLDKHCRLILTQKKKQALSLSAEEWVDYFNRIYSGYLPTIEKVESMGCYPLQQSVVADPVKGRCVLMGNAAYAFYPITAQGFNVGLLDAAALAQLIAYESVIDKDVGSARLLREYMAWRGPIQKKVMRLTQSIATIFDGSCSAVSGFQGLSLAALEWVPGLKKNMTDSLLGLSGKVPDLALGMNLPLKKVSV